MNVFWIHAINGDARLRDGASLRILNLSKRLVAHGHSVYLGHLQDGPSTSAPALEFLKELQAQHFISGFDALPYSCSYADHGRDASTWLRILAYRLLLGYPPAVKLCLSQMRKPAVALLREIIQTRDINAVIVSDRRMSFVAESLANATPAIVDFIDSWTLFAARQLRSLVREHSWSQVPDAAQHLIWAFQEDRYTSRFGGAHLFASPKDSSVFARFSHHPERSVALLNGIDASREIAPLPKKTNRIIFTGNMCFSPNLDAAFWFIDHVMPVLRQHCSDLRFVVAGAEPPAQLLSRASDDIEILGYVPDIAEEIAKSALYVAPMVSGGGFKNKVVEALLAGTFVACTPMGAEFLPSHVSGQLLIGTSAADLAARIEQFFANRTAFDSRIPGLRQIIRAEFGWDSRADELLTIMYTAYPTLRELPHVPQSVNA
jgi:polysaccharide biosynthesis protein PslH